MSKGRWFPDLRTGTREQWQAYRTACFELFRNTRYESKAGIRVETPRSDALTERLAATAQPLTRTQQSHHWRQALTAEDRDFMRLQRAADRQRKQGRSRR